MVILKAKFSLLHILLNFSDISGVYDFIVVSLGFSYSVCVIIIDFNQCFLASTFFA